jgi:hypothetical protein
LRRSINLEKAGGSFTKEKGSLLPNEFSNFMGSLRNLSGPFILEKYED